MLEAISVASELGMEATHSGLVLEASYVMAVHFGSVNILCKLVVNYQGTLEQAAAANDHFILPKSASISKTTFLLPMYFPHLLIPLRQLLATQDVLQFQPVT